MFILTNTTILAILFGIAFLFITLQIGAAKRKTLLQYFLYSISFVLAFFIIKYNSRIVWFGIVAVWAIIYLTKQPKQKKQVFIWLLCLTLAALAIAFYYKQGSTFGRLLIYKIEFQIIKENWLTGIRQQFNPAFNHAQSGYFLSNANSSLNEKLLASNGFFPFNEWLAAFIHWGIVGFILAVLVTIVLVKECFRQLVLFPCKAPVIAIIFFMLITAVVSYPFHFNLYNCILVCSIIHVAKDAKWWPIKVRKKLAPYCLYSLIFLFFSYREINDFITTKNIEHASELQRQGYINEALASTLTQATSIKSNGQLYYLIAKIYFQKNKIDSSLYYLGEAHQYLCTDELHNFWGDCLSENSKLNEANTHYLLAVNIMPCKFKSRLSLIENYLALKYFDKAILYAKQSIELPEKIPSFQSAKYKQQIRVLYDSLKLKFNCKE